MVMKVNIVKESLLKPNKKFTLLSAFITLLNDRLSESILLPILPSFVLLFDSKASTYGLLSCTYQLAQFTASPFIGLMSDRYGRRPVTLFCITGSVIGISILSFTVLFNWSNSIASIPLFLLFLARLIDGLSGGTAATATTILADISSPEKRAKTFGLIGVAFGLSFFLGNIFVVIFARNTNNNFIIPVFIAQSLASDFSLGGYPSWFIGIDYRYIGIVPIPVIIFTVFAIVVGFFLSSTIYGKQLYLIGTNPQTAKYSGIKVDRIKLLLFTLSGLVCGIAGVLTTSRLAVARFNMATGAELEIVLMVMLGGTYIFGGRGNIFGTFVAFWIVVILRAGLNVARIKIESQLTILGAMLIIAIILTNYIYSKSQK